MNNFSPKLGAAIVLLTERRTVNRTALNKLCFFADVASEIELGSSITHSEYRKLPHGPVPVAMEKTRASLVSWGFITERAQTSSDFISYDYSSEGRVKREVMLRDQSVDFNQDQIRILENCRDILGRFSASALSAVSHQFEPWKSAEMGAFLDLRFAANDDGLRNWLRQQGIIRR